MSASLPSDEVADDYRNSLEDLITNDRYQISTLTLIAKENIEHAEAISRVLQNHIQRVCLHHFCFLELCHYFSTFSLNFHLLTGHRRLRRGNYRHCMSWTLLSRTLAHLIQCISVVIYTQSSFMHILKSTLPFAESSKKCSRLGGNLCRGHFPLLQSFP